MAISRIDSTGIADGGVAQADLSYGVANNGPIFYVQNGSTQNLSQSVFTKAALSSEQYDTNNCWDNTTYRFTPNVAGFYIFNGYFYYASSASYEMIIYFFKNGSAFGNYAADTITSASRAVNGSKVIYLNGTTDYVEMYVYINVAAAITGGLLELQGYMVRSA